MTHSSEEATAAPFETPAAAGERRSGIVAIVGRANVGKSTLMNRILDEKVSIVSRVAQTTRNLIRGVLTEPRGQMVLLDTPGVHKATTDLGRLMNKAARVSIEGADVALLVVDVSSPPREEDAGWMTKLIKTDLTCVVALNKCDINRSQQTAYQDAWKKTAAELKSDRKALWIPISAQTGQEVDALTARLFDLLPKGPPLFPEEMLTDFPRKWNFADVIREKLFLRLRDEVPHSIAVLVEKISELDDSWLADVTIYCDRPTQRPIILGHKGNLLRDIQKQAEAELSEMYDTQVRLYLWIKVQKDWAKNYWLLKQMGYV